MGIISPWLRNRYSTQQNILVLSAYPNFVVEIEQAIFGIFLIIGGVLTTINHPVVDWFNRWVKSVGTTSHPSDIEMSTYSIELGRIVGALVALFGLFLVITAISL